MCTTHVCTYSYPDGRVEQACRPVLCHASRHGQVCGDNVLLRHSAQYVQYPDGTPSSFQASAPLPSSFLGCFPPAPSFRRRSRTPNRRSADESDRSRRSSPCGRRPPGVYVNGQRVLDINRRERDRHARRERIVVVENPPTPSTPPQVFSFPHTAPSSPVLSPHIVEAVPRESHSRRPVIVDERPRPHVEVVDGPRGKHSRHPSAATQGRPSFGAAEDDARQRRREREAIRQERRKRQAEDREACERVIPDDRARQRIAEANAEIASRPAVPMPSMPRRASSFAAREGRDREAELMASLGRLDDRERRREEELARRANLRERAVPRRRATVGPGSRRHRVLYDDGVYRWE
ncbi:hypothetical protein DCS_03360 [Drechmeria coniospora]|uniref:Uncharacterized protein n=1 Tax=Drechmeria coniospora TaxID=98403 RepID=A0A151GGX6_DRECN|nr:hypothetical protein DCS_03360 [Drechmeria coniospora]KYK56360.1 hypothetical protein DCS_03360 [Drechmeria coniospora]ODA76809.1 hypothetical protein RJ55_07325 [Drechmeria coniospora]